MQHPRPVICSPTLTMSTRYCEPDGGSTGVYPISPGHNNLTNHSFVQRVSAETGAEAYSGLIPLVRDMLYSTRLSGSSQYLRLLEPAPIHHLDNVLLDNGIP